MAQVQLENVMNFRDVGGHATRDGRRVRTGRIFRSAHLAQASDADLATLADLGIRVVVDFRGPADIAGDGEDRLPPGAEQLKLPMFDVSGENDLRSLMATGDAALLTERFGEGRGFDMMCVFAAELVTHPERCAQFSDMLRRLAEPGGTPALVHCSAGKDRTGWAASLILLTLGVPEDDVVAHYLESNIHYRVPTEGGRSRLQAAGIDPALFEPFIIVHEDYARSSLRALEAAWGGIDGYLHDGLGLDDELVERFRAQLLED